LPDVLQVLLPFMVSLRKDDLLNSADSRVAAGGVWHLSHYDSGDLLALCQSWTGHSWTEGCASLAHTAITVRAILEHPSEQSDRTTGANCPQIALTRVRVAERGPFDLDVQ